MPAQSFHDATSAEIVGLARTLAAARVIGSEVELAEMHAGEPWRVQVGGRGDVAVLGRWRDHLPYLSIEALWCPTSRAGDALAHIRRLGHEHGFVDTVSPPTPIEDMYSFEAAGMRPQVIVATYQLADVIGARACHVPEGIVLREAVVGDSVALLATDARCFDLFWRYDARHLASFFASSRLAVAEHQGEILGYTLCTVHHGEGLLGRLCVVPEWRRRGVGSALVRDAVRYVREQGGDRVMLSTQTDNAPSQALYRRERFRDTGRRFAFLRFGSNET